MITFKNFKKKKKDLPNKDQHLWFVSSDPLFSFSLHLPPILTPPSRTIWCKNRQRLLSVASHYAFLYSSAPFSSPEPSITNPNSSTSSPSSLMSCLAGPDRRPSASTCTICRRVSMSDWWILTFPITLRSRPRTFRHGDGVMASGSSTVWNTGWWLRFCIGDIMNLRRRFELWIQI